MAEFLDAATWAMPEMTAVSMFVTGVESLPSHAAPFEGSHNSVETGFPLVLHKGSFRSSGWSAQGRQTPTAFGRVRNLISSSCNLALIFWRFGRAVQATSEI